MHFFFPLPNLLFFCYLMHLSTFHCLVLLCMLQLIITFLLLAITLLLVIAFFLFVVALLLFSMIALLFIIRLLLMLSPYYQSHVVDVCHHLTTTHYRLSMPSSPCYCFSSPYLSWPYCCSSPPYCFSYKVSTIFLLIIVLLFVITSLYWFPLIVMMLPPSTFNVQVVHSWCIVKVATMTTFTFFKSDFFFLLVFPFDFIVCFR